MESSNLVIFSTSGKFITEFNVLHCINLNEKLFWTGARGRIPITLNRAYKLLQFGFAAYLLVCNQIFSDLKSDVLQVLFDRIHAEILKFI